MKRVLVLCYSQSGETARVARSFVAPLEQAGANVMFEALEPKVNFPYPWRSVRRFFDAMPESVLGIPPKLKPLSFDVEARFDLVIIAYPVWFLSPAPAVQAFFQTDHVGVLKHTDVITVSVSRAMWHRASEILKGLLARAEAEHRDGVVVTHRGSPLATLVSTPRAALFGRQDRLFGLFPQAGVSQRDLERVKALGAKVSDRALSETAPSGSWLAGEPAVRVRRWLILPESLGMRFFQGWALLTRRLGRLGAIPRAVGVYTFPPLLATLIIVGLPLALLAVAIAYPIFRPWLDRRASKLAAPTGENRG